MILVEPVAERDPNANIITETTESEEAASVASLILGLMGISLVFIVATDAITLYQEWPNFIQNIKDGIQNIKDLTSSGNKETLAPNDNPSSNNHTRPQRSHCNETTDRNHQDDDPKTTRMQTQQNTQPSYKMSVHQAQPPKQPYYKYPKIQ